MGGSLSRLAGLVVLVALAAGCGSPETAGEPEATPSAPAAEPSRLVPDAAAPLATVDGEGLVAGELAALHVDVQSLTPYEVASSVYLLVLHEALLSRARTELGVEPGPGDVEAAFAGRTVRYPTRADLEQALAGRNEKPQRVRIEAALDALRSAVSARLVLDEVEGFDIDAAYRAYLIDNAEVCVEQMLFDSVEAVDAATARLEAGEDFALVARDLSSDPFVDREPGRVGAGGDLGCSAPAALPLGLDRASLAAPLGEPHGPVATRNGIGLLVVYDRTVPPLSDVRRDVLEHAVEIQGPDLFRLWAVSVLESVEVEVDPAYGAWGALPETEGLPTVVPVDQVHRIVPA